MTPLVVMSQPTRCTYIGAGEGLPPLRTLHGDTARAGRFRPAWRRPSPGRSPGRSMSRRQAPGVQQRTVAHGRQIASRFLRVATALRVTAAANRAGSLLRTSPAGWPAFQEQTGCAAPLSRRTGRAPLAAVPLAEGRGSMNLCPTLVDRRHVGAFDSADCPESVVIWEAKPARWSGA